MFSTMETYDLSKIIGCSQIISSIAGNTNHNGNKVFTKVTYLTKFKDQYKHFINHKICSFLYIQ